MTTSPCVGSCRLDPASQLCTGCARSGAEITAWKDASAAERARVWARLPARRARLGIGLHRLDWTTAATRDFVAASLRADGGSWTIQAHGVAAWFTPERASHATIDRHDATITATTAAGSIRFTITDQVRVLALPGTTAEADSTPARLILALPRSQAVPRPNSGLTPLGFDRAAIQPADRAAWLFDLGLNSAAASVGLRTESPDQAATLDRHLGQSWDSLLREGGDPLAASSWAWVVANPVVRLETSARLRPDESSSGVRVRVGALAPSREVFPPIAVPESFVPCALFDPAPGQLPVLSLAADLASPALLEDL